MIPIPKRRYPSSTLFPFLFWVSLLKLNVGEKKGTLTINRLLGNLEAHSYWGLGFECDKA